AISARATRGRRPGTLPRSRGRRKALALGDDTRCHPERERGAWRGGWHDAFGSCVAPPARPGPSLSLGVTIGAMIVIRPAFRGAGYFCQRVSRRRALLGHPVSPTLS